MQVFQWLFFILINVANGLEIVHKRINWITYDQFINWKSPLRILFQVPEKQHPIFDAIQCLVPLSAMKVGQLDCKLLPLTHFDLSMSSIDIYLCTNWFRTSNYPISSSDRFHFLLSYLCSQNKCHWRLDFHFPMKLSPGLCSTPPILSKDIFLVIP